MIAISETQFADIHEILFQRTRTLRGCRDMLREAAKQLRLQGDPAHAKGCDDHADMADAQMKL